VGIKALDFPLVMKDLSCLVEESLIKKMGKSKRGVKR